MCLFSLQEDISGRVCYDAIKSLTEAMRELLLSDKNPKVNMSGIKSFDVDLKHCESKLIDMHGRSASYRT